jgi:heme O synthase-like polyprenyltransferase
MLLTARAGWSFAMIAGGCGVAYTALSFAFLLRRDRTRARRLFFSSLLILPILLATLVFESLAR